MTAFVSNRYCSAGSAQARVNPRESTKTTTEPTRKKTMNRSFAGFVRDLTIALALAVVFPTLCAGQGMTPQAQENKETQDSQDQQLKQKTLEGAKIDPKEEAAYKAFFDANPQDADAKIRLGTDFLKTYPNSHYAEAVNAGLVQAYYQKQDWNNFYTAADRALALNPNNVDVLVIYGWVTPHLYNGSDPDSVKRLDQAEANEKKAIDLIPTLPKPVNLTDDQFTEIKNQKLAEAHSGLGLVDFRRQNYDDSVKELQQAVQGSKTPDPTDLFALGAALQNSQHYTEAANAFNQCAQILSNIQDQCKQQAATASKLAAQTKK
jgi:tetratricopeptide (TPR) repeat protein